MSRARIPVTFNVEPTPLQRLERFLAPYDVRLFLTERSYLDIGSGSLGIYNRLSNIEEAPDGLIGAIGRWCEVSASAQILAAGEHDNDNPVNVSLSLLQEMAPTPGLGMKAPQPFSIGNGVVISANAVVLSGRRIGDGAVIGAGAVVSSDIEAYAIAAGVPARPIRKRKPAVPWWNFATDYLIENMPDLQRLAASKGPHRWREDRPPFVVRIDGGSATLTGFWADNAFRPIHEAPSAVIDYLTQALSPGDSYWMPDCWA